MFAKRCTNALNKDTLCTKLREIPKAAVNGCCSGAADSSAVTSGSQASLQASQSQNDTDVINLHLMYAGNGRNECVNTCSR